MTLQFKTGSNLKFKTISNMKFKISKPKKRIKKTMPIKFSDFV